MLIIIVWTVIVLIGSRRFEQMFQFEGPINEHVPRNLTTTSDPASRTHGAYAGRRSVPDRGHKTVLTRVTRLVVPISVDHRILWIL